MPEDKSLDDIAAGLLFVDEVQKFLALVDAELAVDVAHVGAHGALMESTSDLRDAGRGEATRQIHEHLGLAGRKAPGFGHLGAAGLQGVLHARLGELEGVAGRIGAGRKCTLVGGSRDCRRVLICRAESARGGPGVACSRMHGRSHSFRNGRFARRHQLVPRRAAEKRQERRHKRASEHRKPRGEVVGHRERSGEDLSQKRRSRRPRAQAKPDATFAGNSRLRTTASSTAHPSRARTM